MTGHIFIYGVIGTDRQEISFDNVNKQINDNKSATDLTVHIISPGGDVFEGEAIYNALKNTGKKITTHIEGTCASIATLIAGAGDRMIMNKTARFMIHNPVVTGMGQAADARDLRHVADQLDQIKSLLIDVYDRKTSLGKEKLWALYDNETWLTADEAVKMGFVDESVDAIKAVARVDVSRFKNQQMEQSKLEKMFSNIVNLFKSTRFKNQATDTLEDGRVIVIMAEGEDWNGAQVMLETGEALPAGDYKLASGKVITVDANNTITQVAEGQPANEEPTQENPEDMEKDAKIKQLEEQLAAATAASQAANAQVAEAKANQTKFENRLKAMEQVFLKEKEKELETVGDRSEPGRGPAFKNIFENEAYDPMGEDALAEMKRRHLI